jgi:colicin import membrane protein
MPKILRNLKFKASEPVSLVDVGANQHAKVVLFKRDKQEAQTMGWFQKFFKKYEDEDKQKSIEDIMGKLTEEEQAIIQAAIEAAAEAGKLSAEEEKQADEEQKASEDDAEKMSDEEEEKTKELPEDVKKRLDKLAHLEKRERQAAKIEEFKKSMAHVPVAPEVLVDAIEAVEAADKGAAEALSKALVTLSEVAKSSALFKELGTTSADEGEPMQQIEAIAKRLQAEKSVPFSKALVMAAELHPDLYAKARS